MQNKKLEEKLQKAGYSIWVQILENCETDKDIVRIKVDKKQGFTDSAVLNRMIETYLNKLNVKVHYVDMKKEYKHLVKNQTENRSLKPNCNNVIFVPPFIKVPVIE